jgi:hypothetical protein
VRVYRWDLDKTYLDTDIESVRALIRAAFESASSKRTIPGASALLRALTLWDPGCRVSIVSGSPTQMRAVLEEKLAIDGVRFDSLVLKDSLGNLRRGRLRAVRGQIGYKLPRLLQQRIGLGPIVHETLFGDDAEVDAVVYAVYADAVAGRIGEAELARVMEAGGAYEDSVDEALRALRQVGRAEAVEDIFIHLDKRTPMKRFHLLGSRVVPVFSWLQAALILWTRGRLGPSGVVEVARACTEAGSLTEPGIAGLFQDLVRRRHLEAETVERLLAEAEGLAPAAAAIRRGLARLGPLPARPLPGPSEYLAFLRSGR